MTRARSRAWAPIGLAASFGLMLPAPAGAARARQKRKELEEVRAQLEQKKKEAESYRRLQQQVQGDLLRLEVEKRSARRMLDDLRGKRQAAEVQKQELAERFAALSLAHGKGLGLLYAEVIGYSRYARGEFAQYGSDELWEEALRRSAVREKTRYLARLSTVETQTAQARLQAQIKDRELHRKALQALADLRARQDNYARKQAAYEDARTHVTQTLKEIQELEDSARALTSLVKALERKGPRPQEKPSQFPPVPQYSLPWPVVGRVIQRFGKERVPELKTWVIHNGIEIAAAEGTVVQPVDQGKVIFAGPFRSYGKVIIVDHGRSFYTIYGQLKDFLKKKGDQVARGVPIAVVGGGRSRGVLYFEIRQGGVALDPLMWLQK